MLKLLLSLIRDNAVYLSMDFTATQFDCLHSAIAAGFVRVQNTRYALTPEGVGYLENER